MSKELDLEIYDIVKIVEGDGRIFLECIYEIDKSGKAYTESFEIDFSSNVINVECRYDIDDNKAYQLDMVWTLDSNRNYTMIYPVNRLESLDNANPSEALIDLEKIKIGFGCDMAYYGLNVEYEIIKQTLLKAQEQEKEYKELKENVKRWHDLLLKSGIDIKGMVAFEIEEYWAIKAGV